MTSRFENMLKKRRKNGTHNAFYFHSIRMENDFTPMRKMFSNHFAHKYHEREKWIGTRVHTQKYFIIFVSFCIVYSNAGDSMMYQHTVSGIGCSGSSPTSTPPNINACSSSTPPLANVNHQNASAHDGNSDQMVSISSDCTHRGRV